MKFVISWGACFFYYLEWSWNDRICFESLNFETFAILYKLNYVVSPLKCLVSVLKCKAKKSLILALISIDFYNTNLSTNLHVLERNVSSRCFKFHVQIYVELLCLMGFYECLQFVSKNKSSPEFTTYGRMNVWKASKKREIVINMKTFLLFLDQRCVMILVKNFSQNSWLFLYFILRNFKSFSVFTLWWSTILSFTLNLFWGEESELRLNTERWNKKATAMNINVAQNTIFLIKRNLSDSERINCILWDETFNK